MIGPKDVEDIVSIPPGPHDDLLTGIRVLSEFYWTQSCPLFVREKIREWVRGALDLTTVKYEP